MDLPAKRIEELNKIMTKTGLSTRKDLFENALTFFAWAVSQRESGRTIASIAENSSEYRELLMPALAAVNSHEAQSSITRRKIKT